MGLYMTTQNGYNEPMIDTNYIDASAWSGHGIPGGAMGLENAAVILVEMNRDDWLSDFVDTIYHDGTEDIEVRSRCVQWVARQIVNRIERLEISGKTWRTLADLADDMNDTRFNPNDAPNLLEPPTS